MRLKKLQLIGFKSFANKTDIFFDNGVTCVVGPNGCGKSNISDSIRWVLGERSAKLLRGSKMEDVIFNGTDFRKPLSFAEVSLTFDNEDRGLPIDYNEVTITRRLHRSGESEYLINKTNVRLKDVQDLILDTGCGSNSYSMIEQGRIDYILNADPEKRRFLIEEAAGISKYKVKKEEAIRKLNRTEDNILRLDDIIQEVRKNIQYAERQAKRAEKYKQQYDYLKDLEIRKAFYDLEAIERQKSEFESSFQGEQQQLELLDESKISVQAQLKEQEEKLNVLLEGFSQKESERHRQISQQEKNDQQLQFHQEKRMEFATRRGEISQEKTQLNEQIEQGTQELEKKSESLKSFEAEVSKIHEALSSDKQNLEQAENALKEVKALLEKSKEEAFEMASQTTRARNEYHRLLAFLETSERQKDKMDGSLERFSSERVEWESKFQIYSNEYELIQNELRSLESKFSSVEQKIRELEEQIKDLEIKEKEAAQSLHERQARLNVLKKLDQAAHLDQEKLKQEIPDMDWSLVNDLRDVLKVKPGYEWALEAALRVFAQSMLVEKEDSARKLLSYFLNQEKSSQSMFVWNRQEGDNQGFQTLALDHPLVEMPLLDVLDVREGYKDVLNRFFKDVFIAKSLHLDSLHEYLQLSKNLKLVTREGLFFGFDGQVFVNRGGGSEEGFFQRRNEMETLEREISQSLEERNNLSRNLESQKAFLVQARQEFQRMQQEIVDKRVQKESVESNKNHLQERLSSHQKEEQLVMAEILELKTQRSEVESKKAALEQELNELEAKEKHHRECEQTILHDIQVKDEEKDTVLRQVAQQQARFDHLDEQMRLVREAVEFLKRSEEQNRQRLSGLEEERERIDVREKELDEQDVVIQEEQASLAELIRQLDLDLELLRQKKSQIELAVNGLESKRQKMEEEERLLSEKVHQSEMQVMEMGYQEKAVHERMNQSYQVILSEVNRDEFQWEDRDVEKANAELEKLREKMKNMGAVNMLAIEEYDELKERYDFMMGQRQDLENARTELMEAIRKINRTTKSLFEETFNKVHEGFKEYYSTLFRGGEAKLVILDESKPLESGIDIVVRPPAKKPQHISLLSGGEKALTAIALLFALFKVKPSPFCVLDEVDAPLDEANIDRFLTVLKSFLKLSQFIIITHNRKTISMGDSLYGVTMEEPGVSRIVSVKMGETDDGTHTPIDELKANPKTVNV